MIENIIEKIKEAEIRAKEIIQDAKKQHGIIIEDAYKKSSEIENSTRDTISKIFKEAEEKAVADAAIEVKKLQPEYKKRLNDFDKIAELKEKEAIDLVIKKVIQ